MTLKKGHQIRNTGRTHFKKRHKTWNKNLKGTHFSPNSEFKKGHKTWNKGKTPSEETKQKLREFNLGKKHSLETRKKMSKTQQGHYGWTKGKTLTKEHKLKLSKALQGDKSPYWKGGISFEPYGTEFNKELKEQIRKRDSFRCQQCFRHQDELFTKKGNRRKLTIHHIDFNKKNNHPDNLISLCINCHSQTQFNREGWIEYFQNKIL